METNTHDEYHQWFYSLEELRAELPAMIARTPGNKETLSRACDWGRDRNWLGGVSVGQFYKLLDSTWPAYAGSALVATSALEASVEMDNGAEAQSMTVRRRKRVACDYGDELSMPRVWGGELSTAWSRAVKRPRAGRNQRYATIYVDLTASGSVQHGDGVWRSATAMMMHDHLLRMGYSVEIWAGCSVRSMLNSNNRNKKGWYGVRIKEYDQPLNNDRLATMTSIATLRTLIFEMIAGTPDTICAGFGIPLNAGLIEPLRERAEQGERIFRVDRILCLQSAKQYLKSSIASLREDALKETA